MKTKIIQVPIYKTTLQVLFGDKEEVKDTLVNEYKMPEHIADEFECENCDGMLRYVKPLNDYFLWMPNVPTTISNYGTLVHELQHFVFILLDNIGMQHTKESDEAYSYLITYMFCEIDCWINDLKDE